MFDQSTPPEDIFDKTEGGNPTPPSVQPGPTKTAPPASQGVVYADEPPQTAKKIFLVCLIGAGVIVIAGGLAYFLLSSRAGGSSAVPDVSKALEETTPPAKETVPKQKEKAPAPAPTPVAAPEPDADKDGLSDAQEAEIGTSSVEADTDGDELFDREEVEVYHTNPLVADTDGDGYADGTEVSSGYNPNGSGKLFTVPGSGS